MATVLLNLDKIGVNLGGRQILQDANLELQMGQRVGLVGANGAAGRANLCNGNHRCGSIGDAGFGVVSPAAFPDPRNPDMDHHRHCAGKDRWPDWRYSGRHSADL